MSAPEKLRAELARLRDRGYTFRQSWPVAVNAALRDESIDVAVWWREVWNEQRSYWQLNFSKVAWRAKRPTLSTFDDDHSEGAGRRAGSRRSVILA